MITKKYTVKTILQSVAIIVWRVIWRDGKSIIVLCSGSVNSKDCQAYTQWRHIPNIWELHFSIE